MRFLQAFEAQPFQRRLLRVAHCRLDFAFAIGIAHATGHGHGAVVSQHIAIEGIQGGIVNIGDQHAFAQIIQNHHSGSPTQAAKGLLVEFGPDATGGAEGEQAYRLAAVGQRHHEQPGAAILAAERIAHHRPGAVINLGLFAGIGDDHHAGGGSLRAVQSTDEALDALIAAGETVEGNQVLPDGDGIAAAAEAQFDQFPVGLAGTGRWTPLRPNRALGSF